MAYCDRDNIWAYAAVFGMLWGGLELTLGTFLHVLHFPKTGLIMAMLSLILLTAQRYIYPVRGSTLAAGVVAACIKCLSPGGIILGPVLGIISEALLVELGLLLGSRRYSSAIFAGGLVLIFSQVQSVLTTWIYYGQDFIDGLCRAIERFFSVPWTAALGWTLLLGFLGITFVAGGVCGVTGSRLGRRATRRMTVLLEKSQEVDEHEAKGADLEGENAILGGSARDVISRISVGKKKRSQPDEQILRTRRCLLVFAVITLIAQLSGELILSFIALNVWLVALFLGGRSVLRAIWWPKFWALTIGISLICGVLLAWNLDGEWAWMIGIEAACRMNIRGIYVFSLVNWATRCVTSDEFLSIWSRVHLENLGKALEQAYSMLPEWLDHLNELIKGRPKGIRNNMHYAYESLLDCLVDASKRV